MIWLKFIVFFVAMMLVFPVVFALWCKWFELVMGWVDRRL